MAPVPLQEDPPGAAGTSIVKPIGDVADKEFAVVFRQPPGYYGWIFMDVTWPASDLVGETSSPTPRMSTARISSVYCPMQRLVRWMHELARGADPLALRWEDEGSEVELVYASGRLWLRNREHAGWWHARLQARQVAKTFYKAYRAFVEGPYDRTRYEARRCLREVFIARAPRGSSLTGLLLEIAALNAHEASRVCSEIAREYCEIHLATLTDKKPRAIRGQPRPLNVARRVHSWDKIGNNHRMRILRRLMARRIWRSGSATNLRHLRSRLLDHLLAQELRTRKSAGGLWRQRHEVSLLP